MTTLEEFLAMAICDSVNAGGHRYVTFTQTDGQEVTACADCGLEEA